MDIPFRLGLHHLGNDIYAYLQPSGSWSMSNAGLITDGDQSLLVDTLYDLRLTGRMLEEMRRTTKAAEDIDILVNTHANGDHSYGNQLVAGARMVASRTAAEEMLEMPPPSVAVDLMRNTPDTDVLGNFLREVFGSYGLEDVQVTPPTETFDGEHTIYVGAREVRLIEVGPAHTRGDTLVYLPADRVMFTGDILFEHVHPFLWTGPVENWIAACDRILSMDVDVLVPGHGAVTDKGGVERMRTYFTHLREQTHQRYQAGMTLDQAVRDIPMDDYAGWADPERVVANVAMIYHQLGADVPVDPISLFTMMGAARLS